MFFGSEAGPTQYRTVGHGSSDCLLIALRSHQRNPLPPVPSLVLRK